jgi:hypothetical protein
MKKVFAKGIVSGLCALLAACAFITVNVYFPEKDVKKAYKSLDEMLLKQGGQKGGETDESQPVDEPKSPESKPVSMFPVGPVRIAFAQEAYAQEDISDELAAELSRMPEVQKAYSEMKARLPQLNALRDSGAVGEGNGGNVVVRDKGKLGNNQALVDAENANRKTVIFAMAKAILKLTGQPENDQTVKQARLKAARTFAATKQEEAKSGWWIQPNGNWVQK